MQWADRYRHVSKKNSADPGRWKTSRVPSAYGPYLALTERDTTIITVVAGTQILKTEFLMNAAAYFIHQDPSSILFIQPTQKLAEDFSKERFAPTRESTPVLRELIADPRSRDSGVTITHKEYPGGTLDFVGANSPADLASRPKRIVLADEIDKYPPSAGSEGDPLSLGEERASTFWNRKQVRACSPTVEATSRIWREYMASDQRKLFVACPHCGDARPLRWSDQTVVWSQDRSGNHLPESARYHCEACGVGWSEAERKAALRAVVEEPDRGWRQTRPFRCCGDEHRPTLWNERGRSLCPTCRTPSHYDGHAGFQVSKLCSTRHKLADLVREFLSSRKSPEKAKKWINTALAEPTREAYEATEPRVLRRRAEPYTALAAPAEVRFVTVGVDTQGDRLEGTWLGWGVDEELWVLKHEVMSRDPSKLDVWRELDALLKEPIETEDGRRLNVQATCIDSQGRHTEMVLRFCRERRNRRVYAIKGSGDGAGTRPIWPKTPSRSKNATDKLYIVGVDTAKDEIFGRLPILPSAVGEPVPNAIHFPSDGLSADYFEQLTAEKAVVVMKAGVPVRRWVKKEDGARNEALDCMVYGMAARHSLPMRPRSGERHLGSAPRAAPFASPIEVPEANAPAAMPVPAGFAPPRPSGEPVFAPVAMKRPSRKRWAAYA